MDRLADRNRETEKRTGRDEQRETDREKEIEIWKVRNRWSELDVRHINEFKFDSFPGASIHDSKAASFAHQATSLFTDEFLTLPLQQFRRIVDDKMNDVLCQNRDSTKISKRVVIVMSHPRSGGSLLAQCFEDVEGEADVYNEPEIFMHFAETSTDKKLLRRIVFCFCRSIWSREDGPAVLAIKMPPHHPWLLKPLLDIEEDMRPFFDMSFLFIYRNPIDTAKSALK